MKCGPSVPIRAHRQLDAESANLVGGEAEQLAHFCREPRCPCPETECRGFFVREKPRQVTTLRSISRGALGRLPLGYNVRVQ